MRGTMAEMQRESDMLDNEMRVMKAATRKSRRRNKGVRHKEKRRRKTARAMTPSSDSFDATIPQRQRAVTPDREAYEAMVTDSLQSLPPRPSDMTQREQIRIVGKGMGLLKRSPVRPYPQPPRYPPTQQMRQQQRQERPRQSRQRASVSRSWSPVHVDHRDALALRQIKAAERREANLVLEDQERARARPLSPDNPDREASATRRWQAPSPHREPASSSLRQRRDKSPTPRPKRSPHRRSRRSPTPREQRTASLVPRAQTESQRHSAHGRRVESQGAWSSTGRRSDRGGVGGSQGRVGSTWNQNKWC